MEDALVGIDHPQTSLTLLALQLTLFQAFIQSHLQSYVPSLAVVSTFTLLHALHRFDVGYAVVATQLAAQHTPFTTINLLALQFTLFHPFDQSHLQLYIPSIAVVSTPTQVHALHRLLVGYTVVATQLAAPHTQFVI